MDLLLRAKRVITAGPQGVYQKGAVGIKKDRIVFVGKGADIDDSEAELILRFPEAIICPGLIDCHTHLMESAAYSLFQAQGSAQELAAKANLMTALRSGITTVGDHVLADLRVPQDMFFYIDVSASVPLTVRVAFGIQALGTEPPVIASATNPGEKLKIKDLTSDVFKQLAAVNQFPGENIFLNATPADMPLTIAPRSGEEVFPWGLVEKMIDVFHVSGKAIGAHAEGDSTIEKFVELNGDVVHHAHGMMMRTAKRIAQKGVQIVMTPHGGTSHTPNSPADLRLALKEGITVSIASDSYSHVHHCAKWIPLPAKSVVGPPHFMMLAGSILRPLKNDGVSDNELIQIITKNPAGILGLNNEIGTLEPGKYADLLICRALPAIETNKIDDILVVMRRGEVVVKREI